ncbi:MAG: NAD(P)-dependent oxidoreductase [Hyphomicrobiales bacterium]|nr:NAD(P)-dependent oxidoreductase [Hyphomicrobiales bacterium]
MRVLLTGAGGFIGGEIARELRTRGHEVAGFVRRPVQAIGPDDFAADFLQPDTYREPLARFAPDALIHAGWWGVAPRQRDLRTQLDNVQAVGELVAQAAQAGAKIVIGLGTQAEYGLTTSIVDEDAPTRPVTLYGVAKLAAGGTLLRLAQQNGMRGVWGRVFGVYGPFETAPSLLPTVARELAAGRAPRLTPCTQPWDFLHVRDVASAVADLLDCEAANGIFNIARGEAAPLRDTVLRLRDLIDASLEPAFGAVPFGPEQIRFLGGDPGRLMTTTDWRPVVPLEAGLREVAQEAREAARLA